MPSISLSIPFFYGKAFMCRADLASYIKCRLAMEPKQPRTPKNLPGLKPWT